MSLPESVVVAAVETANDDDLWEDCESVWDEVSCCSSQSWQTSLSASTLSWITPPPSELSTVASAGQATKHTACRTEGTGSTVSIGSKLHPHSCTPCKFFRSRRGCLNGSQCELCHHPHAEMTTSAIRKFARQVAVQKAEENARLTQDVQVAEKRGSSFQPLPYHRLPPCNGPYHPLSMPPTPATTADTSPEEKMWKVGNSVPPPPSNMHVTRFSF